MSHPTDTFDILRALLVPRGVSGHEGALAETIARLLDGFVDEISTDAMGNLLATRHADRGSRARRLLLAAHADEIGFLVTGADEAGFLTVSGVGGISPLACAFEEISFENGARGVLVPLAGTAPGDLRADKLRVDIGARSRREALDLVPLGASGAVPDRLVLLPGSAGEGFFAARPLDDRVGCAVMIAALRGASACRHELCLAFTAQEEVGCRGAGVAASSFRPDLALAFDVTGTGDAPGAKPMEVRLGGGAAVKVKDSSVICDPGTVAWLIRLAEERKIPYQREILEAGGTDTSAMQTAGGGCRAGAISIPTRYIHSNVETACRADIDACVALTRAVLESDLPL